MKKTFLFFLLLVSARQSIANTYVTAVVFSYDNSGNRILRQVTTICTDCEPPGEEEKSPQTPDATAKETTNPGDTITSNDLNNETFEMVTLKAYPNPMDQNLTVENMTWKNGDKAKVTFYDITGKLIFTRDVAQSKVNLAVTPIAPGTYQLHYFLNGRMIQLWKIVKQ